MMDHRVGALSVVSAVMVCAGVATAIPPAQLVASSTTRVVSWDFPGAAGPYQITDNPGSYRALATDSLGNLYGALTVGGTTGSVKKFAVGSGAPLGDFVAATGGAIVDLSFTASDELLALRTSVAFGSRVERYDASGMLIGNVISLPTGDEGYSTLAVGPDGRGYASRFNSVTQASVIDIFDTTTGASLGSISSPVLNAISNMDVAADGAIYLTYSQTGAVYKADSVAGSTAALAFAVPSSGILALAIAPSGNIYLANSTRIEGYTPTGGTLGLFAQFPGSVVGDITFGNVVPGPASAGVMGLAGWTALRRRR